MHDETVDGKLQNSSRDCPLAGESRPLPILGLPLPWGGMRHNGGGHNYYH